MLAFHADELEPGDLKFERPATRGDCAGGERPCPFVGCRHNLYLDVLPDTGSIKFNRPELEPEEMPPELSCSLDCADDGPHKLDDVADRMNVTRERARQIEVRALHKLGGHHMIRSIRKP